MPSYPPLGYAKVAKILKNLKFVKEKEKSGSHETWVKKYKGKGYAVTVANHGDKTEFKPNTLNSMVRQSGYTKEQFYKALKK